ncbi:YbaK/EbsC family protein [Leucobacter allii]|uniref:YbaK/EbsC family protein n=1 Tax=Leucobacter allii TaxID=2932247 RepID=UPI001FD188A8|nr:YbaK/EbsC family protein [Leucobacter allii]UOR02443.1 YbaK/EbsC family protein [Leucobacter allii]
MTTEQPLPQRSQIVQQHLNEAGLPGRVRELPDSTRTAADAASALGCEVGAIASSLLFLADDEPVLVMTSGRHRVDTGQIGQQLGAASVTMAPAKLVREITGQAIGGVSPVGHPARLRTVVDEALADYEAIWAAGGTPRTVFPLTFADLVAITGGTPIRVADD